MALFKKRGPSQPVGIRRYGNPKSSNGCSRCPAGRTTPCTNPRHQCDKCNGLGVSIDMLTACSCTNLVS